MADAAFRRHLQQLRGDRVQRTAAATEAVRTLLDLLQPSAPHTARLGAARSVLEIGVKLREVADLEERLAALERQQAERGKR